MRVGSRQTKVELVAGTRHPCGDVETGTPDIDVGGQVANEH